MKGFLLRDGHATWIKKGKNDQDMNHTSFNIYLPLNKTHNLGHIQVANMYNSTSRNEAHGELHIKKVNEYVNEYKWQMYGKWCKKFKVAILLCLCKAVWKITMLNLQLIYDLMNV